MGLPVAAYYAHRGASVIGVDIDPVRVDEVNAKISTIGSEPGMDEHLAELVAFKRLSATTSYREALSDCEVVIVLVPLVTEGGVAVFSHLDGAVQAIADHANDDTLVIFETTLPVGTTRHRFTPVLREHRNSLKVAFSPERVSSGRTWRDLDTYPKLVGGVDVDSTMAAVAFYYRYLPAEVQALGSSEAAELTKLAETTYRDVNIAFANDLARFADEWGVDVQEVIASANSQPFSHIHQPGVGVGGHCIPHYPHLLQSSTSGSQLIAAARETNERMPGYVVSRIVEEAGPLTGKRVLLLGLAYRPGVPESASSPVFDLVDELVAAGANAYVTDPLFEDEQVRSLGLEPWSGEKADVVVLVTDHPQFHEMDWAKLDPALVFDGRNALEASMVLAAGHRYVALGR
jgi:nucleotide sugar dehydrogenase